MLRNQKGFTLIELLVTMIIFVLAIAAASQLLVGVLTQFKQQSKIAETNIEGLVGLQLLKDDIEKAGVGVPLLINGIAYNEVAGAGAAYNDASDPPRGIVFDDSVGPNNSDVIVIKAASVAANDESQKWTHITNTGTNPADFSMRIWSDLEGNSVTAENLIDNVDRVIVLRADTLELVSNGANFFTTFNSNPNNATWAGFRPDIGLFRTNLVYGINDANLRMPFNRADFFIVAGGAPARCAPGTGVLVKSVIEHATGNRGGGMPLLDCVADMQVVVGRDTNGDGEVDSWVTAMPGGLDAFTVRSTFKQVRVYILAHEGQRDTTYNYSNVAIVNITDPDAGLLKAFDLNATVGATWSQYRWKIYTITARLRFH